jgi:hypothetical protein
MRLPANHRLFWLAVAANPYLFTPAAIADAKKVLMDGICDSCEQRPISYGNLCTECFESPAYDALQNPSTSTSP